MFILLYVMYGLNMLIKEKFLCWMFCLIKFVNFFKFVEKFWVINVVSEVNVSFMIDKDDLIDFLGVFFVLNFILLWGDVCFFVKL